MATLAGPAISNSGTNIARRRRRATFHDPGDWFEHESNTHQYGGGEPFWDPKLSGLIVARLQEHGLMVLGSGLTDPALSLAGAAHLFAWAGVKRPCALNGPQFLADSLAGALRRFLMPHARSNWHEHVFFGIHYDLHANAEDMVLGKELTREHLRERLLQVQPDWIQCDCKGHPGYSSWPTKVGSMSPGVVNDQLRIHRDVTKELGIKLGVHYSGVWDSRAIELHPDWGRRTAEGEIDPNITCRTSDYDRRLMIPQMIEIIDTYDVDGFWVDGENWASKPCWCERCRAEFTRRTGIAAAPTAVDQPAWDRWLHFHRDLFVEHVTTYTEAVHTRKPDCTVVSNWMYTVRQPEAVGAPVDYISGDYDWAFGSNRAAIEGRVMDSRDMSWDLMAWGFSKTRSMGEDPPWTMKTAPHLQQELAEVVALGGAVMVYNAPQRTGWLTGWHQEIIAEAARFCRVRQDTCWTSQSVPQVAVLHLADHYYANNDPLFNYGRAVQPVEGALHALLETHCTTDVLTQDTALRRMEEYKLAVVPEQTHLSERIVTALEAFAEAGGHVLISGAHLAQDVPELVGAVEGEPASEPSYLPVDGRAVPVSGPWQLVRPAEQTTAWISRLKQQEPEKDATDQVVVTQRQAGKGSIVAVHGPIFRDYYLGHYPLLRRFIGNLVERFAIRWMVTLEAPPWLELILRQKNGKLLVNLINRGAGEMLSSQRVIVEELLPVQDIVVYIRRDKPPVSVLVVPDDTSLNWSYADAMLTVKLGCVEIHSVLVIE